MKKVSLETSKAPIIVLVRPQLAENIGMVARAMMNCGLCELRLVSPREDWLSPKAVSASSGAAEILEQAKSYDSLSQALADIHFVLATTARLRDMTKPLITPEIAAQKSDIHIQTEAKVAWVFGPERTGLENNDLILSDMLVQIPLNPAHSSLNLSQAVLLMAYHWWTRNLLPKETLVQGSGRSATKKELSLFLKKMDALLEEKGYYAFEAKKERMKRNLHNIFERNGLTDSELKTLYNVLSVLGEKKKKTLAKNQKSF